MKHVINCLGIITICAPLLLASDPPRVLDDQFHHLRIDGPREWDDFPEKAESSAFDVKFESKSNPAEWTLGLRQQDVKQNWNVLLNAKSLGRLERDENDMRVYFAIPPGAIVDGENLVRIEQQSSRQGTPDDIRAGEIELFMQSRADVLQEATLSVEVIDKDTGDLSPARITITNWEGTLQTTGAATSAHLAVRAGTVYTATGLAKIPLPAGKYKIHAGRGFEYSLATSEIDLKPGEKLRQRLAIRREVPTQGYAACDTHVHTLTHSGHGDASVLERMITLAAEGIELPIATDHNVQIDHRPFAVQMRVQQYFTPVIGNEVTTPVGHFNVFPAEPAAKVPDHRLEHWGPILDEIYRVPGVKVAILNHARDIHRGVRPFGPKLFNDAVGENLEGWPMRFNAMEVINSSATQSDPLLLFQDWMTLLNRGYNVTPIGSSDSHDVARHFVGQGRTYIRCDDGDSGSIDVDEAVNNLIAGRVRVSYGLLCEMNVDNKYTSGDLATVPNDQVQVVIRVLGPHWVAADKVRLYANGRKISEVSIPKDGGDTLLPGVLWEEKWTLPRPKHDQHLVAIATGPGIDKPYWKTAKAYQPVSSRWEARVIGCSGAVWLDGDGDGRKSSAYEYALLAFAQSGGDLSRLLERLADYDAAVAAQAAHRYQSSGKSLLPDSATELINQAGDEVKRGFQNYIAAWRETQIARSGLKSE